ncbi:stage VI sporulation protein D [Pseudobacillus sp. FSL P4-0506]|uniref:stage VI sporulation protein D n=1 Tax=unclassified Pseudobacillus TaxID=2619284 RepID=UPI0030F6DD7E
MASQDLSYLRFSLEETVRFTSGQEVGELYSISLDPQIQTEETDEFIRMHGFLELSGEYAPSEQQTEPLDTPTYKYVQQVLERGENECEFFHHFPIDITIPKSRIAKMEDVEIYIDSFDYEFPEKANLKLTVDLSISGIMEEEEEKEREQVNELVEMTPADEELQIEQEENVKNDEPGFSILKLDVNDAGGSEETGRETDFSVEVKRQPDVLEEEKKEVSVPPMSEQREEKQQKESPNIVLEMESNHSAVAAIEESPNVLESLSIMESASASPSSHHEVPNVSELTESPAQEPAHMAESSSKEMEEENTQKKKKSFSLKKTETMSLADFFSRKESEEAVTWKVCLVQRDDTLQKIAERYELPVADLVRENKLETSQSIEEGQVLYIPNSR